HQGGAQTKCQPKQQKAKSDHHGLASSVSPHARGLHIRGRHRGRKDHDDANANEQEDNDAQHQVIQTRTRIEILFDARHPALFRTFTRGVSHVCWWLCRRHGESSSPWKRVRAKCAKRSPRSLIPEYISNDAAAGAKSTVSPASACWMAASTLRRIASSPSLSSMISKASAGACLFKEAAIMSRSWPNSTTAFMLLW